MPWITAGSVSWESHPSRVLLEPRAEVSLCRLWTRGFVQEDEQSIVYDCEVRLATKPAFIIILARKRTTRFLSFSVNRSLKKFEVMAAENKSLRQKRKVSQHWYSVFKLQRGRFPLIYFGHLGGAVNNSREVSFTLNGHFIEKIWGIRCKFFVNFHCAFIPLTLQRTFFSEWTPKRL